MTDARLERFVEELGVLLEAEAGTPRMVGRTLGWLLVCDPAEQSAAELAQALQASKGSISTATRVLLRMGIVERVRIRGERFDRFRAQPEAWDEFFWREEQFTTPRQVLALGLQELDALYAWWERRIPKLREEYLADRRRTTRAAARPTTGSPATSRRAAGRRAAGDRAPGRGER